MSTMKFIPVNRFWVYVALLYFISFQAEGQRVQIGLSKDSVLRANISGILGGLLVTNSGDVNLDEIQYVEFVEKNKSDKELYKNLRSHGIKLYYKPYFEARVVLSSDKIVRGKIYQVTNDQLILMRGKKQNSFPLSEVKRLRVQGSAGNGFWISLGITMAVQAVIVAVVISYTKFGIFSLVALVPAPLYLLLTGKNKQIHYFTENPIADKLLLQRYQTIRNEMNQ